MIRPQTDMHRPETIGVLSDEVSSPPGASVANTLPHWCMSLTLAGISEQGWPDGPRFLNKRGDVLLIRINTPQWWRVVGTQAWRVIYAVFDPRPHWLSWLAWKEVAPGYSQLQLGNNTLIREVHRNLRKARDAGMSGRPDALDLMYHAVEGALLTCRRHYRLVTDESHDVRIDAAIEFLAANLARPIALEEIAEHCHLSRSQLALLFKKRTGTGPIAFWNQQRIARASQLLTMSSLSIKEVAAELGFPNAKYFSTCFRRTTGMTPRECRAAARSTKRHTQPGRS